MQGAGALSEERLTAYLQEAIGMRGPLQLQPIAGGQSNPTYFVTGADRSIVLRKQPDGPLLPSAHAIDREYRVQEALSQSGFTVPRMLHFCTDPAIIGTPFYVMERLDGRVFHDCRLLEVAADERPVMYRAAAETLAQLHRVDWRAAGLADFGRPEGYFERQVARWSKQWHLSRTRDIPEIDFLLQWLPRNMPAAGPATIAHGDYRIGNLMFHREEPKVIAVLDWELATLGDPAADIAHFGMIWYSAPEEYGGLLGENLSALRLPTFEEFLATYEAAAKRQVGFVPFHMVFALFRFAVIFEGVAARSKAGNAAGQNAADVAHLAVNFARRAATLARTS